MIDNDSSVRAVEQFTDAPGEPGFVPEMITSDCPHIVDGGEPAQSAYRRIRQEIGFTGVSCEEFSQKLASAEKVSLSFRRPADIRALKGATNLQWIACDASLPVKGFQFVPRQKLWHVGLSYTGTDANRPLFDGFVEGLLEQFAGTEAEPSAAGDQDAALGNDLQPSEPLPLTSIQLNQVGPGVGPKAFKITQLKSLGIVDSSLASLQGIGSLQVLESLRLNGNRLTDLEPIKDLLTLRGLVAMGNRITDIAPLMFCANLERINLAYNPVTRINALQFLPSLRTLILTGTSVRNLGPIGSLQQLVSLAIDETNVTDLRPLRNERLESLFVGHTELSDLSGVESLPQLKTLNVKFTRIRELPDPFVAPSLQRLSLEGTRVQNLCPALRLPKLDSLMLPDGRVYTNENLKRARCDGSLCAEPNPLCEG